MTTRAVLGIDTSNYTTSVAAVSLPDGCLLGESRMLLPVQAGEKGLRQSEAFFHHVQRFPRLFDSLMAQIKKQDKITIRFEAVGVSVRPRPKASSYMPVFTAGLRFAEGYARLDAVPVIPTSHQEGHIEAALRSLHVVPEAAVMVVHLSGGTSDVLFATPTRFGYRVEALGEGADLHAGQFVDRIGVMLGLPFPAGPAMEQLAASADATSSFQLSSRTLGSRLSFSGPCTAAERAIAQGVPAANIALAVQQSIANGVVKAIHHASELHEGITTVVVAGGVASNQWIRDRVIHRLHILRPTLTVLFSNPTYASDNAYGVASIAQRVVTTGIDSKFS